jgi:hypothetical protein
MQHSGTAKGIMASAGTAARYIGLTFLLFAGAMLAMGVILYVSDWMTGFQGVAP